MSERRNVVAGLKGHAHGSSSVAAKARAGALPDKLTVKEICELWTDDPVERDEIESILLTDVCLPFLPGTPPDDTWDEDTRERIGEDQGLVAEFGKEDGSNNWDSWRAIEYFQNNPPVADEEPKLAGEFVVVSRENFVRYLERTGSVVPNESLLAAWGAPIQEEAGVETEKPSLFSWENITITLTLKNIFRIEVPDRPTQKFSFGEITPALIEAFQDLVDPETREGKPRAPKTHGGKRTRVRRLNKKLQELTGLEHTFFKWAKRKGVWYRRFRYRDLILEQNRRELSGTFDDPGGVRNLDEY